MAVNSFDANKVTMVFGPILIRGLADGSFVTIAFNEEAFSLTVGTDGEACRARTNNNSARITFTLGQWSETNDLLSGLMAADLLSGVGVLPIMIKDENGTTLYAAETAWIVQYPESNYDRTPGTREWIIETDSLKAFVGGI